MNKVAVELVLDTGWDEKPHTDSQKNRTVHWGTTLRHDDDFHFTIFLIMKQFTRIFGIDVSKSTLDIYCIASKQFSKIENTEEAILKWSFQLDAEKDLVVFESTGSYSDRLTHILCDAGFLVAVVTPAQSHGFAMAQGIISKNDKQAAKTLALMGQRLDLPLFKKMNDSMYKRKQLLSGINALKKQRQALKNQLHALSYQKCFAPKVITALEQTLQTVEQNLEELNEELGGLDDEEFAEQFKLITSVKGIGVKTANHLLSATGGLQNFQRGRQLSKFIGIVPSSHTSGSSIKVNGRITKKGNNALRACLYMAARSAKRFNLACKDLYERLRTKGKSHKKAMVAVMNKLIKQAFGVVKSKSKFDNDFYLKFSK